ncbi:hypothetical protein MTP99_006861 [Tenebrio molitor]|nr:hypothetical protein MTP99_006861 [Tenebrio molitor]
MLGAMPAGASRSWQSHPCRQGLSGPAKNKGQLNPQDPPRKLWHGNWRTRGRSELRLVDGGSIVTNRNRGSHLNNPCERGRGTSCEDSRPGGLP